MSADAGGIGAGGVEAGGAGAGLAVFHRASHNPSFNEIRAATRYGGALVDFCVPVNTHFPPPEMTELIRRELPAILKYYPDDAAVHQGHIAALAGVPAENVVAANGSTEIITALCRDARGPILTDVPTFGRWTDLPGDFGVPAVFVRRERETGFRLEVDDLIRRVRRHGARTLVVCNPNNPTGAWSTAAEIERLVHELSDLDAVILDESFLDFSGLPSAAPLASRSRNLVVVKSMGKALGWHGIRLGYAVAHAETARRLRLRLPYWNVNGLAAFVLRHMGRFRDAYDASFAEVIRDREHMLGRLRRVEGLRVYPSAANFLYCELPRGVSGRRVRDALLERHGLIVRECGNKVGSSETFLRLAVHPPPVADRLADALGETLAEALDAGAGAPPSMGQG